MTGERISFRTLFKISFRTFSPLGCGWREDLPQDLRFFGAAVAGFVLLGATMGYGSTLFMARLSGAGFGAAQRAAARNRALMMAVVFGGGGAARVMFASSKGAQ